MAWVEDKNVSASTQTSQQLSSHSGLKFSNVSRLLAWREISPQAKHYRKHFWEGERKKKADCGKQICEETNARPSKKADCAKQICDETDARHALVSWAEAESLHNLSAKYCPLVPPPRSTIAAAFSSDGKRLASTHGDHTVKIIDCHTGDCIKVLRGHRRTPWVIRFHPLYSDILASGSLDHEVRLWDAKTADCIGSRDFCRPIASIAFHAQGEVLAVASGHKLYIWNYNKRGDASSPAIVLKTRRSLRAVHFHPHGAPFLLTAEVNDLESSDSPLTLATTSGYLQYPPPAVLFANLNPNIHPNLDAKVPLAPSPDMFWPTFCNDDGRTSLQQNDSENVSSTGLQNIEFLSSSLFQQHRSDTINNVDNMVIPMDISPGEPSFANVIAEGVIGGSSAMGTRPSTFDHVTRNAEETESEHRVGVHARSLPVIVESSDTASNVPSTAAQYTGLTLRRPPRQSGQDSSADVDVQMATRSLVGGQLAHFIPFHDPTCWELPFLQGWLMGQTQANLRMTPLMNDTMPGNTAFSRGTGSNFLAPELRYAVDMENLVASSSLAAVGPSRASIRSGSRRSRSHPLVSTGVGEASSSRNSQIHETDMHRGSTTVETEFPTSFAAAAAAELPCTVKLRIWSHDIRDASAPLGPERCCLTIPHAVLCSEMGAHFSPCGRFLVACVACLMPHMEGDPGVQSQMQNDVTGSATSPTRHPISAHQVMYELRIYSIEEATFGMVLSSRVIRAAHCLTSIQFSPTSEHILLAYGRRHSSLLRSIVVDGDTAMPIYTILEVYRVSDMELVSILPSAEDEVNVACFHPSAGAGIVYGTKEGKLRILQYDGKHKTSCMDSCLNSGENMLQAALDHLMQRKDIDTSRIIVFGRSLGGAVGSVLAKNNPDEIQKYALEC